MKGTRKKDEEEKNTERGNETFLIFHAIFVLEKLITVFTKLFFCLSTKKLDNQWGLKAEEMCC